MYVGLFVLISVYFSHENGEISKIKRKKNEDGFSEFERSDNGRSPFMKTEYLGRDS